MTDTTTRAAEIVAAYVTKTAAAMTRYGRPGQTRSGYAPGDAAYYARLHTSEWQDRAVEGVKAAIDVGVGGRVATCNTFDRACTFATVVAIEDDRILIADDRPEPHSIEPAALAAVGTKVHQDRIPWHLYAGDRVLVRDRGRIGERTIDVDGWYVLTYPEDGNAIVERVDEAYPYVWTTGGTIPPRVRILEHVTDAPDVVLVELLRGGRTRVRREDLAEA